MNATTRIKIALFTVIATTAALGTAQAASRNYSLAGCGWGSQVMGHDGSQVLAATTNGTSGTQTFGITSGTSNCTDDGMVTARAKVPAFVETNQTALATDIARGSGKTVAGLSELLGCDQPARFASVLQSHYGDLFGAQAAKDKDSSLTLSIVEVVKATPGLSCRLVI